MLPHAKAANETPDGMHGLEIRGERRCQFAGRSGQSVAGGNRPLKRAAVPARNATQSACGRRKQKTFCLRWNGVSSGGSAAPAIKPPQSAASFPQ